VISNKTDYWISRLTIRNVLLVGLLFRLVAVVFSSGYAFHDDHFEMAELVQRWRDGYSFLWTGTNVHVFSLVYPGFLYLVFSACHAVGLHEPVQIMFVCRLIHALFSMLSIWYAYKLVLRVSGQEKPAIVATLFMSIFWIFPFMSVRNLREFVCIPFLLAGSYYIADLKAGYRQVFLSALMFALAFCVRLQILFIPFGIGMTLLFQRQWSRAISFGVSLGICYLLTQGLFDWIYYGDPIASVKEYLRFNADTANIMIQPTGPWYLYLGTLAGIFFVVPFLLLVAGFIQSWKIKPARMFFMGSLLFFIFHCYYSNKQERFILPFIPYFIILGVMGYNLLLEKYKARLKRISSIGIIWLLILNTAGLFILSFSSSKKSRVESMTWLRNNETVSNLVMEGIGDIPRPPLFYLGKEINFYTLTEKDSLPQLTLYIPNGPGPEPNYLIMSGDKEKEQRLAKIKKLYPSVQFVKSFRPGFVDNIAYRLNPKHNENETWFVYKIK
jgi:hypothetical protein